MTGSRSLGGAPEGAPMRPLEVCSLLIPGCVYLLTHRHSRRLLLDTQKRSQAPSTARNVRQCPQSRWTFQQFMGHVELVSHSKSMGYTPDMTPPW